MTWLVQSPLRDLAASVGLLAILGETLITNGTTEMPLLSTIAIFLLCVWVGVATVRFLPRAFHRGRRLYGQLQATRERGGNADAE